VPQLAARKRPGRNKRPLSVRAAVFLTMGGECDRQHLRVH